MEDRRSASPPRPSPPRPRYAMLFGVPPRICVNSVSILQEGGAEWGWGGGGVPGGCEVFNGREEFCATRVRGIKFHTLTKANSCRAAGRAHTGSSSSGIWCCSTENILQGPRSGIWFYTAISSPTTHNVPPRLSPVISAIQTPI